jgi:hypothetical protein
MSCGHLCPGKTLGPLVDLPTRLVSPQNSRSGKPAIDNGPPRRDGRAGSPSGGDRGWGGPTATRRREKRAPEPRRHHAQRKSCCILCNGWHTWCANATPRVTSGACVASDQASFPCQRACCASRMRTVCTSLGADATSAALPARAGLRRCSCGLRECGRRC